MNFAYVIISWWRDDFTTAETIKWLNHEDHETMIFGTEEEAQEYGEKNLNWNWKVIKLIDNI